MIPKYLTSWSPIFKLDLSLTANAMKWDPIQKKFVQANPLLNTETQENKAQLRRELAKLQWKQETGVKTATDKDLEERQANKLKALLNEEYNRKVDRNAKLIGTGLKVAGGLAGSIIAPELFMPLFAADAAKNLVSEHGIQKTVDLAQKGDTKGAILSGIGDALDATIMLAPGIKQGKEFLDAAKIVFPKTSGNVFKKILNSSKLQSAINEFKANINPNFTESLLGAGTRFTNIPIFHGSTFTGYPNDFKAVFENEFGLHVADTGIPGNVRIKIKGVPKGSNMREGVLTYTNHTKPLQIKDRGIFDLTNMWYDFPKNPELAKIFNSKDILYLRSLGYNDNEIGQLLLKESGRNLVYENATEINNGLSYLIADPQKLYLNYFSEYTPNKLITPKKTKFFYEPGEGANISNAERLGIPKGLDRFIENNKEFILQKAKEFAEKYNYPIPQTIEETKNMYRRHNTFFRGVNTDLFIPGEDSWSYMAPELEGLSRQEITKILGSKGYPLEYRGIPQKGFGDEFVFVAPEINRSVISGASSNGNLENIAVVRRPFRLSRPLKWHQDADFRLLEEGDKNFGKIGTVQIGNAGPAYELKLSTKHLYSPSTAAQESLGSNLGKYLENNLNPLYYDNRRFVYVEKLGGSLNYLNLFKQ